MIMATNAAHTCHTKSTCYAQEYGYVLVLRAVVRITNKGSVLKSFLYQ